MSTTAINSPFRYPGGKFYARGLILPYLPAHDHYVEPFAGGASIFFAKRPALFSQLNDLDAELINCFVQIRDDVDGLVELLRGVEATRENHEHYKTTYRPTTPLERAFRWYFVNRTAYSGIMHPAKCYWGYNPKNSMQPANWPKQLRACSHKLQGASLTCLDFEPVIDGAPDGAVLFVDPPYFGADQDTFYVRSFAPNDHRRLADTLRRNSPRLRFLLTYDDVPAIRELYAWAGLVTAKEWEYKITRTDYNGKTPRGRRRFGRELFIANYPMMLPMQASFLDGPTY